MPADGYIVDGIITIPGVVTLHNQTLTGDTTNWVRVGTEITTMSLINFTLGPCSDCNAPFSLQLDLTKIPTGRHELRISANIPSNSDGKRQYQSTGYEICVRSCTPTYRAAGPYIEARGWYTDHNYANAKITSDLSNVQSGGTVSFKIGPGSGGLATKFAGIYIDPDFHHGLTGTVLFTSNGAASGSVKIPILLSGPHKLVLVSSDGFNAGVLAIPFITP